MTLTIWYWLLGACCNKYILHYEEVQGRSKNRAHQVISKEGAGSTTQAEIASIHCPHDQALERLGVA